jgi:hypothetical protein
MKPMVIALACLILLALTCLMPEVYAQDDRSANESGQLRAAHEEPTLVAHRRRRHCHYVRGHYHRDRYGRRVYVRLHRHCHVVRRHVA